MSDDKTTRGASAAGLPAPARVPTPLTSAPDARGAATTLDDALFAALLSGDERALTEAWQTLFARALRFALVLCRGDRRWTRAMTAEDIAAIAAERFYEAVRLGRVTHINPTGMLYRIVKNTLIDFYRQERDAPEAMDPQDSALSNIATTAPDPEQTAITAQCIRQGVRAWCNWLCTMLALCTERPALRRMLALMHEYLRIELARAQPRAPQLEAATLLQLVESADIMRLTLSLESLNAFFKAHGQTRNSVDLGWKYVRAIAQTHGVAVPGGLTTRRGKA